MISIDVNLTGSQILRVLCNDAEEFAYGMKEIVDNNDATNLGKEMSEFFYCPDEKKNVASWLREIADAIDGGESET